MRRARQLRAWVLAVVVCLGAVPAAAQVTIVGQMDRPYQNIFQPIQTTNTQPALHVTCSWNAAGVTFTCVKVNVTDTASTAGSLLLDLQVAGSSKFSVTKAGALLLAGSTNARLFSTGANTIQVQNNGATDILDITVDAAKTTLSCEAQSVANAGLLFLGTAPLGALTVTNAENGGFAIYALRGGVNATAEAIDTLGSFTITKDNAATINIYYDAAGGSGAGYYLQNNIAGTRTIRACLTGATS